MNIFERHNAAIIADNEKKIQKKKKKALRHKKCSNVVNQIVFH